jgi:hypothetical protein
MDKTSGGRAGTSQITATNQVTKGNAAMKRNGKVINARLYKSGVRIVRNHYGLTCDRFSPIELESFGNLHCVLWTYPDLWGSTAYSEALECWRSILVSFVSDPRDRLYEIARESDHAIDWNYLAQLDSAIGFNWRKYKGLMSNA